MNDLDKIINYCESMKIVTESVSNNNHLIISCFAGVGKGYAINVLASKFKVESIEKYKDFYTLYPTREDYMNEIRKRSMINDILFIPYFLKMNPRYIDKSINYILIYPDKKLKSEYIKRFKEIGFTREQIGYLEDNFYYMIDDCDNQDIPQHNKFKLKNNQYCLDIIKKFI